MCSLLAASLARAWRLSVLSFSENCFNLIWSDSELHCTDCERILKVATFGCNPKLPFLFSISPPSLYLPVLYCNPLALFCLICPSIAMTSTKTRSWPVFLQSNSFFLSNADKRPSMSRSNAFFFFFTHCTLFLNAFSAKWIALINKANEAERDY